jgi:(S)-3,5-dihydroxyphenylglycine transaminase
MTRGGAALAPAGARTLADYARLARASMAPEAWDFLMGGAGDERVLASDADAFHHVQLRPRDLPEPLRPEPATRILGRTWAAPIAVAPMGHHTVAHPEGEVATATAAGKAGVPFVVGTFAGRTLADITAAATGPLWLQIQDFGDPAAAEGLIARAEQAGFEALVLTQDTPHLGRLLRDVRGTLRVPPGTAPANLTDRTTAGGHTAAVPGLAPGWSAVTRLRALSTLPLLVKGVRTAADARRAIEAGADGIIVSCHGGVAPDGAPAPLGALPEIAAEVANACPVLLDGGIRRGSDVLAALALGADAVLVGRPVLHGLAVGQADGVKQVLDILVDELAEAMVRTGTRSVADAGPAMVYGTGAPVPRQAPGLRKEELHASIRDPLLDTMNFLNEITHRYPEAISFAPGRPYDGFFDTEQIFTHIRRYMEHLVQDEGYSPAGVRDALFQYGPTSGRIRELVARSLREDEGIDVAPESIVVTVGCQEAMFLVLRALFAASGDVLLVSSPCYVGITGAARVLDIPLTAVAERENGFHCADLAAAIRAERARGRRPRAFYVVPDHSNPSGTTMTVEERRALLDLAVREDILILEDSPYRLVSPGQQLPTMKSLDRERRVVQLGSFSKTLFPGARVGYAVADQPVTDSTGVATTLADELTRIKSMITVNTSPLSQAVVGGMLLATDGRTSDWSAETSAHYGTAMRSVLRQLDTCLPEPERTALGVHWNEPTGGFFLAVTVPFRVDNAALARSAEDFGVIWTPMSYFYPQGGGDHTLRLSVSYLTQDDITEGIGRLTRFIRAEADT